MKRSSPPKQAAGRSRPQPYISYQRVCGYLSTILARCGSTALAAALPPYGIAILCVIHTIGWLCGLTSAFAAEPAPGPVAWWTFDSAEEDLILDRAADRKDRIEGNYKFVGGPVGKGSSWTGSRP